MLRMRSKSERKIKCERPRLTTTTQVQQDCKHFQKKWFDPKGLHTEKANTLAPRHPYVPQVTCIVAVVNLNRLRLLFFRLCM